jgi:hypothetical protein
MKKYIGTKTLFAQPMTRGECLWRPGSYWRTKL